MKGMAVNKINDHDLPETVKRLNGDSSDMLKKTIKELEEALKKAKERKRGAKQ